MSGLGVDVAITSSTTAPISVSNAAKTVIILADDTENYLTDPTVYVLEDPEEQEPNAALFSRDDLSISGNGTLIIDANYNDGQASKDGLVINGGTVRIHTVDDNDASCAYIHDGYIVLNAIRGDGLDSNGSIVMTGGTAIIHGPSSDPEVMYDCNGTFELSGGLLIASGSSSHMTQTPSSSSTQNSVTLLFRSALSAGTLFHIEDSSGNEIVTFQPLHRYQSMVFSSPDLVLGKMYRVYLGGTSDGESADGLYAGGAYSGGTLSTTFTVSGSLTVIRNH